MNNGMDETKKQINDLEHKGKKFNENSTEKKNQKNEDRLRILWDIFKCTNIWIIQVPEEEKEQEIENLFEKLMKENFPNLVKETDIQVQEVLRVPNKLDPKRTTPRHIIIKMQKVKDKRRILKAARKKSRELPTKEFP